MSNKFNSFGLAAGNATESTLQKVDSSVTSVENTLNGSLATLITQTNAANLSDKLTSLVTQTNAANLSDKLTTLDGSIDATTAEVINIGDAIVQSNTDNTSTLNTTLGSIVTNTSAANLSTKLSDINTSIGTGNSSLSSLVTNLSTTNVSDKLSTLVTQTNAANLSTKLSDINISIAAGNTSLATITTQTNAANLSTKLSDINTSIGTGNTSLSSLVTNLSTANVSDKLTTIETKVTSMDIDTGKISDFMEEVVSTILYNVKEQQEVLLYNGTTDYYTGTNVDSNFLGYVQNTRGADVYVTEYRLQIICLTVAASLTYDRFWDSTTAGGAFTIGQGSSTASGTFGNSYVFNNSNIFAFLESTYTAATETYYNFVFPCNIHCPDQNYIKWKINGKMPVTSKYSVVAKYKFLS